MYLAENTFDLGSLAVTLDAMAVALSAEATDEIVGIIDEKHGVGDVVFLGRLGEKLASNRDCIRRRRSTVETPVRCWIDGGVQPVLIVVDSDRLLLNPNAIRPRTVGRL